ncbi:hypothetical protein HYDPIDRAFT_29402 [Hydnomerulius pinastri MD-312]|uniref:NACHT domain-containing protein n=1 Tax=Hydnomerulius pinastri MD-312 TaxID=994086 RepID=A0A0C9WE51_9AGAM|nr:hypothetical protein HYDPIDRAFT_29402 [Hydnomerulius pinastri MD-312]
MDGLSAAATVLQVVQVAAQVTNALGAYVSSVKGADSSRQQLLDQIKLIVAAEKAVASVVQKLPPSSQSQEQQALLAEWFKTDGPPAQCKASLEKLLSWLEAQAINKKPMKWKDRLKWPTKEKKISAAIQAFDRHMPYFHAILSIDTSNSIKEIAADVAYVRDQTEYKQVTAAQLELSKAVLGWFDAVDCTVKHEFTRKQRQKTTGDWLFNEQLYIDWRSNENKFLWLNGKAGAGKSVLASTVVDKISCDLGHDETLAYFYCDFRNSRCTSAMEVLRSLTAQFLRQAKTNWLPSFSDLVERKDRGAGPPADIDILSDMLKRAAKLHDRPIIVVDALDECDDLLDLLSALVGLNEGHCRFFVTSRTVVTIKEALASLPSICLDDKVKAVHSDMESHLKIQLESRDRLRFLRQDLKEEIRDRLMKKADGMFRWVQCQLDRLNDCRSAGDIREVLDTLPSTLYETYERIIRAIDRKEFDSRIARRALMWLVTALEPLPLSQLAEALAIDPSKLMLDPDIAPMRATDILVICGSLVSFEEQLGTVSLSHYSVKEYLTSSCATGTGYFVHHPSASLECASISIQYLILLNKGPDDLDLAPISFFDYAVISGFRHLVHCIAEENELLLRLLFALQDQISSHRSQYQARLEHVLRVVPTHNFDLTWLVDAPQLALYVVIRFGHLSLVQHYLDHRPVQATEADNPLVYAACFGEVLRVRMLLDAGLDVNMVGLHHVAWKPQYLLPLEAAVTNPKNEHQEELIRLLLARGSFVPRDIICTTLRPPLYGLCQPSVIRILLDHGADARYPGVDGNTPLHSLLLFPRFIHSPEPSSHDCLEVARLLVEGGCDPTAPNNLGCSPLQFAIRYGHESVVLWLVERGVQLPSNAILDAAGGFSHSPKILHLLLRHGVAADVRDEQGNGALHYLFSCWSNEALEGCMEAMQLLVEGGCDIDSRNHAGETPMHVAAQSQYGKLDAVEFLIGRGARLPADIVNEAAKHLSKSNQLVTRLVLQHGAGVRTCTANGDTALHSLLGGSTSLSEPEILQTAQFLWDEGCDIQAINLSGVTPLHIAARKGYTSIVHYLLDEGAQPPADIAFAVVQNLDPSIREISRMLLRRTIDPGTKSVLRDPKGNSLLHVLCGQLHHITDDAFLERVQLLQEGGHDLEGCGNATNNKGFTPLEIALVPSQANHPAAISYLIGIGAHFSSLNYLFLHNFAWASHLPWYPDAAKACRDALMRPKTTSDDVSQVYRSLHGCGLPSSLTKRIMDMAEYWVESSNIHHNLTFTNRSPEQSISLPSVTSHVHRWIPRRLVFSCRSQESNQFPCYLNLLVRQSISNQIRRPLIMKLFPGLPTKTMYVIWDGGETWPELPRMPEPWAAVEDLAADDTLSVHTTALSVHLEFFRLDMYFAIR